jgi:acyl-CoA dehydrogenase
MQTSTFDLYTLPDEHQMFKNMALDIVNGECIPLEPRYLREDLYYFLFPEDQKHLREVSEKSGIFDAHIPKEFGGGGLGFLGEVIQKEAIYRSVVLLPHAEVPAPLYECNNEQKDRYLYPVIRGEKQWAFAQTEPDSGSDFAGVMKTRAVRDGDDWLINGRKTFVSFSLGADFWMVQALTDPEKRSRGGITMFLVDKGSPGVEVTPLKLWFNFPERFTPCEVAFDDVRVPPENVLGEVGGGFALGQFFLIVLDRLLRGGNALGQMQRAYEMSVKWASERMGTGGKVIGSRQAIQWMLVDMLVDITTLRSVTYGAAARCDQIRAADSRTLAGEGRYLSSLVKLISGQWGFRVLDNAIQIHGGYGESLELPLTRFYRMLRHSRIGGGTDEIQRMMLSRYILGRDIVDA